MIRTLYTIVPLFLFAFTHVKAQHTFDVKFNDADNDYPGGLTRLSRYTTEKTFISGITRNLRTFFAAIDNNGLFVKTLKLNFRPGWKVATWLNRENNLLYAIVDEDVGTRPGFPWHLITMDTNLNLISNTVLDSSIMGVSRQLSTLSSPIFIRLRDSSFLLSVSYLDYNLGNNPKGAGKAYIIDQRGNIVRSHTFSSFRTYDEPLYQMQNGNILWRYSSRDTSFYDYDSFRVSDTNFNFSEKLTNIDMPQFLSNNGAHINFVPTMDSGFALLRMVYEKPETAELIKYNSEYKKQWSVLIPSHSDERHQLIENKNGGFFVVTQTITDTTISLAFQECLQDIAVSKIDADGKYLFTAYYGSGTCIQVVYNAIQDNDGGIIISGRYNASKFLSCNNSCSTPEYEWLFKIDTLGGGARLLTSVTEQQEEYKKTILYPNPTTGILYINTEFSDIHIFNSNGESVYHNSSTELMNSTSIDISGLLAGLYFCRIKHKNGTIVKQFIVQH